MLDSNVYDGWTFNNISTKEHETLIINYINDINEIYLLENLEFNINRQNIQSNINVCITMITHDVYMQVIYEIINELNIIEKNIELVDSYDNIKKFTFNTNSTCVLKLLNILIKYQNIHFEVLKNIRSFVTNHMNPYLECNIYLNNKKKFLRNDEYIINIFPSGKTFTLKYIKNKINDILIKYIRLDFIDANNRINNENLSVYFNLNKTFHDDNKMTEFKKIITSLFDVTVDKYNDDSYKMNIDWENGIKLLNDIIPQFQKIPNEIITELENFFIKLMKRY